MTVTGRGGVGKSAFASEAVSRLLTTSSRDIDVLVSQLDAIDHPSKVVEQIANDIGAPLPASGLDALAAAIGEARVLLVLDNFEHLRRAATDLTELRRRCPNLTLLITSQASLHTREERVITLSPFPLAGLEASEPDQLASHPAVAMYCDRAAAVDRHFAFDGSNCVAIAELCRRLDGLPMAIELAAARAATLPAGAIVDRFEAPGFSLTNRLQGDLPARHHDLRSTLDWTIGLVSPSERRLLEQLSLVSGPFDLDMVAALSESTETWLDDFESLVDFHLVDALPSADGPWFTLPPTIRAFAAERLAASAGRSTARIRHVRESARWARLAARGAEGSSEGTWLEQTAIRRQDLLAGLQEAVEVAEIDAALDLVLGLAPFWRAVGYDATAQHLTDAVLAAAAEHAGGDGRYPAALAWSIALAIQHRPDDDTERRLGDLARAEELARACADPSVILRVLASRVLAAQALIDAADPTAACDEGLALSTEVGLRRWQAAFEVWSGMLAVGRGDIDGAVELGLRGLEGARLENDRRTIVLAAMLLRPLAVRRPDIMQFVPTTAEAMELARLTGQTTLVGVLLPFAATEAMRSGDLDLAAQYLVEGLALGRVLPPSPAAFSLLASIGYLAAMKDHQSVVWLDAVLAPVAPVLSNSIPPGFDQAVRRAVAASSAALDSEVVVAARQRAAGVSIPDALPEVERLIRASRPGPTERVQDSVVAASSGAELTARQLEVLRLLASGLTNREIALRLHVAPKTVMHHLTATYRAIGVRSRSEATAWAFRHHLAG